MPNNVCMFARAEHLVRLLVEHYRFRYEGAADGSFCLHLDLLFPTGKGALQSQQGVPIRSRVYNWQVSSVRGL